MVQILFNQTPKIAVTPALGGVFVNPMTMEEGEMELVAQALRRSGSAELTLPEF